MAKRLNINVSDWIYKDIVLSCPYKTKTEWVEELIVRGFKAWKRSAMRDLVDSAVLVDGPDRAQEVLRKHKELIAQVERDEDILEQLNSKFIRWAERIPAKEVREAKEQGIHWPSATEKPLNKTSEASGDIQAPRKSPRTHPIIGKATKDSRDMGSVLSVGRAIESIFFPYIESIAVSRHSSYAEVSS